MAMPRAVRRSPSRARAVIAVKNPTLTSRRPPVAVRPHRAPCKPTPVPAFYAWRKCHAPVRALRDGGRPARSVLHETHGAFGAADGVDARRELCGVAASRAG